VLRRDLQPALSSTAIGLLLDLVTAEGALPIGAPTSPALLNRVLLRSDEILTELAASHGVQYTRYADDLTFSGDGAAVKMLGHAKRVLGQVGLELDPKKTNIFRRGRRQTVTGLTVNDRVSVPRKLRRELRAAVHAIENGRDAHWHGLPQSLASMRGRLAFLAMAHPAEAQALREKLEAAK
jgi:retron-type reverse transcriptase